MKHSGVQTETRLEEGVVLEEKSGGAESVMLRNHRELIIVRVARGKVCFDMFLLYSCCMLCYPT